MLSYSIPSKIIAAVILTLILCSTTTIVNGRPELESFYENNGPLHSMGSREPGDELIIKDVLRSPYRRENSNNSIKFHYPIKNRIVTYIELGSDSNVGFEFSLGVTDEEEGGFLTGTVTALEPKSFDFKISVYGFERNEDTKYLDSILIPKLVYQSKVEPNHIEDNYFDEIENDEDNVVVIGNRQPGDHLLYTEKKSSGLSDTRTDHSVTFYYIDNNYITCVIFTALTSRTATATYSKLTPHSLKATINDVSFELNANMEVYGFLPDERPDNYIPPLPDSAFDLSLDGVKLLSLSNDVEVIETLDGNILPPENLCSSSNILKISIFNILGLYLILTLYY
ncbi:uncharacterized protein LOC129605799 [Condylostylus longicornis]|uniref:uncharacterized protein LOC129605799 n=1 Tax=Condylostylus longicornis TaxID=2530218 RepID=UPI00244DC15A|nr:uncharacterized protein LOC129605799 [Condylostylus longicornis]